MIIPPSHIYAETAVSRSSQETQLFAGLSPDVCGVEEMWFSPKQDAKPLGTEPLVILLQEAHVNYGAQKNIVKTLEHFQKKFKSLNLSENLTIGLEGNPSEKEIDPILFRAFPLPDVTRAVTDSFMYQGKIDGAEFYAINSNQNARLFGIDDDLLYQENLLSYQLFHENQDKDIASLNRMRSEIEKLKEKVYAKPLKDLEESRKRFGRDTGSLRLHLKVLEKTAKLKNISLEPYPLVLAMQNLFDQESRLTPEQLEEKIRSIRSYEFFDEMNFLEETLYSEAAVSRDEKLLVEMDRNVGLLEKLASLSLTQGDFKNLEIVWPIIQHAETWKSLDDLFKRRNISFKSWNLISSLLPSLENARDFYLVAETRDSRLTKNVEKLMDLTGQKIIFVVAGGFHTQGMTSRLREQGISYVALMPMANPDEDEIRYWNRLSGTRSEIQNILAGTSTVKPKSLQGDSEFQKEAVVALIAAAGQSLGPEGDFKELTRQYVDNLNVRDKVTAGFVQQLLTQFNILRSNKAPGGNFLIPLNGYFFFSRRWVPDVSQQGGYWFPAIPMGYQEVAVQGINPTQAEGNYYSLAVVMPLTQILNPMNPLPKEAAVVAVPAAAPAQPIAASQLPADLQGDKFAEAFNDDPNRKYTIIKVLGKGGMGKVYEAKDAAGNSVAIKAILGNLDSELVMRLQREAVAGKSVKNRHVMVIYDFVSQSGKIYLILEKLTGQDLEKTMQGWNYPLGETEIAQVLKIMLQTAEGVKAIHDQGFSHRDLKPANIFMVPGRGPVVTDFGLVRNKEDKDKLTESGTIMGTPNYMSPEQAYGERDITDSSDIFSMGIILYELLTGKRPFDRGGKMETLQAIIMDDPKLPREGHPKISETLNAVIMKSLSKTPGDGPGDRYRNVDAFIKDLLRVQQEYLGRETAIQSASNFDRSLAPASEAPRNSFAGSLAEPIEAMGYMEWRKKHMKWYNRLGRQIKKHPIIYSIVLVAGLVGIGTIAYLQKKMADDQLHIQRENAEKFENAKMEIGLADREIRNGNYDSAISHLNQAKSFLRDLDRREESIRNLNDEIDVKTRFISTVKAISAAEEKLNSNQGVDLTEFKTLADQLAEIIRSKYISDEVKASAQLSIAKARLLQFEPDFVAAAKILNSLQLAMNEGLRKGSAVPQKNIQDVNSAIINLFRKSREASFLTPKVISALTDFGYDFSQSLVFKSVLPMDEANIYMNLGYFSALQRSEKGLSAEEYYELAVNSFNQIYHSETNAALKEEALWSRGMAELRRGKNEDAINTFNEFRENFSSSSKIAETGFRIAQARNEIGVKEARNAYDARFASRPFADNLAAMKSAFQSARLELKNMLAPLDAQPMNDLTKLRLQSAIVDSYFLESASIAVMYRNLLMFSPQRTQDPLLGDLYQYRNVLEREVKDDIENLNSPRFKLRQFTIQFVPEIQGFPENVRISTEDAERLTIAVRSYEMLGILKGLQNADFVNAERVTASAKDSATYFDSLGRMTTPFHGAGSNLIRPYLGFLQIVRGTERISAGKTFFSEGLVSLAEMYRSRGEAIRNRSQDPEQLQRIRDNASRAASLLIQDPTLSRFASIMSEDAKGRSLGAAPDIFKDVKEEKRLSPVIMEFNETVLKQLIDKGSDLRQGNKKLPVFFLVSDASELRRINKENPNLWKDYRIGLLEWKFGPMSEMTTADVDKLMNLGRMKVLLRSLYPEGEVTQLRPEQVVFMNNQFNQNWTEETRRVKFDQNSFDTNEQYRSAYLTSAFYLVNRGKGEGVFQYNRQNQTLELLPAILADLLTAWKSLKETLVSA